MRPGLSVGPLIDFTGALYATREQVASDGSTIVHTAPTAALAEACGVARHSAQRWISRGRVPFYSAERVCDFLRVHPCEVWGDEWIEAVLVAGAQNA